MNPEEIILLFGKAAKDTLVILITNQAVSNIINQNIQDFQIILYGSQSSQSLRSLTAEHINKLVKVYFIFFF